MRIDVSSSTRPPPQAPLTQQTSRQSRLPHLHSEAILDTVTWELYLYSCHSMAVDLSPCMALMDGHAGCPRLQALFCCNNHGKKKQAPLVLMSFLSRSCLFVCLLEEVSNVYVCVSVYVCAWLRVRVRSLWFVLFFAKACGYHSFGFSRVRLVAMALYCLPDALAKSCPRKLRSKAGMMPNKRLLQVQPIAHIQIEWPHWWVWDHER